MVDLLMKIEVTQVIRCYFCQSEYQPTNQYNHHQPCPECPKQYPKLKTYTIYDDSGKLINAQIYVIRSTWITIPGAGAIGRFIMHDSHFQCGWDYQFRLEFDNHRTVLTATSGDTFQKITEVTGFPITPANAEEKLNLYLTFS